MRACNKCYGSRYWFPKGKPDMVGPCPECNANGEAKLVPMPLDSDPFPFGSHKGKKYEDVPASYLLWMADQPWASQWASVMAYIEKHRTVLEDEVND